MLSLELGISADIFRGMGTIILNNTAADVLDDLNFDAIVDYLEEFDEPFHYIKPRDIRGTGQRRDNALRAIEIPKEGV
ncbi:MAG: hypothetical protein R3B54_18475 [Bdellovibrionota bacterium]